MYSEFFLHLCTHNVWFVVSVMKGREGGTGLGENSNMI